MKELVIAEKPSVARDVRVLKCQKQLNGAMEGEKIYSSPGAWAIW